MRSRGGWLQSKRGFMFANEARKEDRRDLIKKGCALKRMMVFTSLPFGGRYKRDQKTRQCLEDAIR